MALSRKQDLPSLAAAMILHGWALAAQGQVEGVAEMRRGLDAYQATKPTMTGRIGWHCWLRGIGRGPGREGLQALAEALAVAQTRGLRVWEASCIASRSCCCNQRPRPEFAEPCEMTVEPR
jgi:hypothetical protein